MKKDFPKHKGSVVAKVKMGGSMAACQGSKSLIREKQQRRLRKRACDCQ